MFLWIHFGRQDCGDPSIFLWMDICEHGLSSMWNLEYSVVSFGVASSRRARRAYGTDLYCACRYPRVLLRHRVSCAVDTVPKFTFAPSTRRRSKYGTRSNLPTALRRRSHRMYAVRSASTRPSGVCAGEYCGREPHGKPRCFDPCCFRSVLSVLSLDWLVHYCVVAERFHPEVLMYTNLSAIHVLSILLHQTPITLESGRLHPTYTTCIGK